MQIGFGLDPADQIDGALAACGRAEGQQENIFAQSFTDDGLALAPEVRGDESAVLDGLCGAGDVGDDTGQLACFIEEVQQLDAGIVAAFQRIEVGGVGIAPHGSGLIIVLGATAHTDGSAAELIGELGGLHGLPGTCNSFRNAVAQEEAGFAVAHNGFIGGQRIGILDAGRCVLLEDGEGGTGFDVVAFILHGGVGMGGGEDQVLAVKFGQDLCQLFADIIQQAQVGSDQVTGAEDNILIAHFQCQSGGKYGGFDIFGNSFAELATEVDLLFGGQVDFSPTGTECTHGIFLLKIFGSSRFLYSLDYHLKHANATVYFANQSNFLRFPAGCSVSVSAKVA